MEVKDVQPEKALPPIEVTPSEIVTEVNPVQPEKALPGISVVPSGMSTDASVDLLKFAGHVEHFNVPLTVIDTLFGNAFFPIEVALEGIVIEVKLEQPENALSPIEVTLEGIATEVKLEQPLNAELSMLVTLSGIVMLLSPEQ